MEGNPDTEKVTGAAESVKRVADGDAQPATCTPKNLRARVERDYPDLNTTGKTEKMVAEMFREWMDTRDTRTDTGKLHYDLSRDMSAGA